MSWVLFIVSWEIQLNLTMCCIKIETAAWMGYTSKIHDKLHLLSMAVCLLLYLVQVIMRVTICNTTVLDVWIFLCIYYILKSYVSWFRTQLPTIWPSNMLNDLWLLACFCFAFWTPGSVVWRKFMLFSRVSSLRWPVSALACHFQHIWAEALKPDS